jgi:hypothetical protein
MGREAAATRRGASCTICQPSRSPGHALPPQFNPVCMQAVRLGYAPRDDRATPLDRTSCGKLDETTKARLRAEQPAPVVRSSPGIVTASSFNALLLVIAVVRNPLNRPGSPEAISFVSRRPDPTAGRDKKARRQPPPLASSGIVFGEMAWPERTRSADVCVALLCRSPSDPSARSSERDIRAPTKASCAISRLTWFASLGIANARVDLLGAF